MDQLIKLPSVDSLLKEEEIACLITSYGRKLVVDAIRQVLDQYRQKYLDEKVEAKDAPFPDFPEILVAIYGKIDTLLSPTLIPVINATGVILHTNLGRAPLCKAAIEAMQEVAQGYSSLEFDLERGKRSSRSIHAEQLLTQLSGAEAAIVVNNNAAAVLLTLTSLARRRRVVIARSQLVEIGGGFRLPTVMSQSGARLIEVGTTNRVNLNDYEDALQQPAAMILSAHHSNYKIIGFTEEPTIIDLSRLKKKYNVHLVDDLGSGALLDTSRFGLAHEPTVQEAITAGADLVCFSGDKLLGGPQAGIIVGKGELISKIKKHQLARAVRVDKLCLAALTATLICYVKGRAEEDIPVWQMISATPAEIEKRSLRWQNYLRRGDVINEKSTVGGGSLPEETLPTHVLALQVNHPNQFLGQLRVCKVPIIARVANEQVVLDPRTVLPEQEEILLNEIKSII